MERWFTTWIKNLLWVSVIIQTVLFTVASNITTVAPQTTNEPVSSVYAWSSWGSWSPCSRTCGGGVAMQERQCLPRSQDVLANDTLPPPVITVRLTRRIRSVDCVGVRRRYHQCNTAPCSASEQDTRAEQCAAYDRRPFRGRFYTWIPYIDGDSPCTLNCRPLGQHFYASLALVADGTPCTKPGLQAICVQGVCKVVGREAVLAVANTREMRCGRRLVSGLFSRPKLPLGYTYVTTVPQGACRLNVSEIAGNENYIALKISNGSYIINGEFAVSAPGTYEAAGARFLYTRQFGRDIVLALGPIHQPIDIMILYTQPNPSIKYEYFTESIPGEIVTDSVTGSNISEVSTGTKHNRRYHAYDIHPFTVSAPRYPDFSSISKEYNSEEDDFGENVVGTRRFMWKILSYTQCTRTCGGGIQVGKYRCVETNPNGPDKEVSPVHCLGSPPAGRRRRCGHTPCTPRWRAAAWSQCPKCGPATRTRIVGCVQDHSRGITKVSDQKCLPPKPATSEPCNIVNCDDLNSDDFKYIEKKRVIRPREHTDSFRDGPVYTVSINSSETDFGPEDSFSAAAGWLYTEWSQCVGWCVGGGVQSRGVRCADPSGCAPRKAPDTTKGCTPKMTCDPHEGQWFTGEWSACSSRCGGKQVRGVLCVGGGGRRLREAACRAPRPDHERDCGTQCSPVWYYSDWGECAGNCSTVSGVQRRTVWCAGASAGGAAGEAQCVQPRPHAQRVCALECNSTSGIPPDLTIESQRTERNDNISTQEITTKDNVTEDCKDKLNTCALAVRARLCHYVYYMQNCCNSCKGR